MKLIVVVCLLGFISLSVAQFIQDGQCDPNITLASNLNIEQTNSSFLHKQEFAGTWYEISRSENSVQGDCSVTQLTYNNGIITITNTDVNENFPQTFTGTATQEEGTAKLTLNLVSANNENYTLDFWLLLTDPTHEAYALAYSCEDISDTQRSVYIWRLERQRDFVNELLPTLFQNALTGLGININDLRTIDHSELACYILPVIDQGQPIVIPGQCDSNITVVQNFDAQRFSGLWHETASYYSENVLGTCSRAEYSFDGGIVSVLNSQVINQVLFTISGTATVVSEDNSGVLNVILNVGGDLVTQILSIIATDYDNYAVSYSCDNVSNTTKRVYSWVLSRTRQLSTSTEASVNNVIDSILDLNRAYYQDTARTDNDCFYYPEHVDNQPVVFRGNCDVTIPTVQNFNATAYLGLWHDIESYPSMFQGGTCNNALYSLNGDVIDVYNTQVVNQTLDTINGEAIFEGNATEGKLLVTFPIAGTNLSIQTNYWVLATDYTSYSLVYTCVYNEEDETRNVWSWKLSRTKQLTQNAINAINTTISNIPVLDERYYQTKDQSSDGCFYFPEPESGKLVVFPGQCEANIPVVANFNLTQFGGIWYEIEAYPQNEQSGQCISHEYTDGVGQTLDSQSTFISDQLLQVKNGSVSFAPNVTDNSGKLLLNIISSENLPIEIEIWILDIDYTDYALAYSCIQIDDDFRGVWSWKLSRTRQLSTAAVTNINSAIASIQVLDQQYYEIVGQTDADCFYLPELGPDDPVVFIGECANITAIQDFQWSRFSGRWYDTESYNDDFEGNCLETTYLVIDNEVDITITEVREQTLYTTNLRGILASDGSGTFTVNVDNDTSEYVILATNYNGYALLYVCNNLGSNTRRVRSWKLGREKELTASVLDTIQIVMNDFDVLDQQYFYPRSNSEADCFYYPETANVDGVWYRGQCNDSIPVVQDFDLDRYIGEWYEIESYPHQYQQGTCRTRTYSSSNGSVEIYHTEVVDQLLYSVTGSIVAFPDDNSAQLTVSYPIGDFGIITDFSYYVLATDYDNYSLVYSCSNQGEDYFVVTSWKLSRQKTLLPASEIAINNIINTIQVLRQDYFEAQDHSDTGCFYYPEPTENPVVFPGQCDETILAAPNFDLNSFSGTWYEIEAYPRADQQRQCISHELSVTSNQTLTLFTTQVIAQRLVTNDGEVAMTSNDGSGKLSITINQNGTDIIIPFWIVVTDYNDFALAYGCVNYEDSNTRGVWSWKLSRTQQLSTVANTNINSAIASIQVLDQQYYEIVGQTDTHCFYLPELGPDDPVVFVGECANITTIQDFQWSRFAGRWYVTESYKDEFEGNCLKSTFLIIGNEIDVTITEVREQTLYTTKLRGTLASDGSGSFSVTIGNDTSEYVILSTNYNGYALLYACDNLDSNTRRVRSWKLGREKELTASVLDTIQSVMNDFDVLDQQYFYPKSNSEADCFYYPETANVDGVWYRGQCNVSIPVVQNFDLDRYMGEWYEIESYPHHYQQGTCRTRTYSSSNGSVEIYHTEVVDQLLYSVTGSIVAFPDDNSAQLIVSYPIGDFGIITDFPYYVLATDYDNYSLVYSCSNQGEDYFVVNSWKLSRTKNLTEEAHQQINDVIESIDVLSPQYYEDLSQSEEDCFYYPDNYGGPVIQPGQCPNSGEVDVVNNFNAANFAGTWHQISRFPSELENGECSSITFNLNTGNTFDVTVSNIIDERLFSASGSATASNAIVTASLSGSNGTISLQIYVLDTDYSEFAIAYSCRNINSTSKQVYGWKLSRSRDGLSQSANERIDAAVTNNIELHGIYFDTTSQTNNACFYYPVYDELPLTIELPGPCNETITGKANFEVESYLGRWLEVSRYPQPDQTGQCSRAEYSLGNGVIDVFNSEVVNQTLQAMAGTAVVASSDGSGLLNVTFVVGGVTNVANYYVLETDYTNFAIVYSCRNLVNGNRQVSSWKLSRTGTISNEGNAIIDGVIETTQGLLEEYYTLTSQTDENCFYFPVVNENENVEFRGQCDDIVGVQGFDINRYVGWWHEIERYPTDEEIGECTSSDFQISGDQYLVVDTAVTGDTGNIGTNTVTATTDGRLRRTLINGDVEDTWVLATDYETYSLLYSCENINTEYRRVWSAKHSKSRALTADAQNALAPVIESNQVLDARYFLEVDQSFDACFYWPEPDGEPLTLSGQCDVNIPVVQDFDAASFTGTWFQTERYPQTHETGNCTGARYTLDEDTGVVRLLNWQVVDGVLDTIEGNATVSSDDGSAKLIVELPIRDDNGTIIGTVETDLYILTTDYASYALTYTCYNINAFQRHVALWKLSRTRTMPVAGATAITAYINQRQDLSQDYFIQVAQSDECEEPSSGLIVKSTVIVILVCVFIQLFV